MSSKFFFIFILTTVDVKTFKIYNDHNAQETVIDEHYSKLIEIHGHRFHENYIKSSNLPSSFKNITSLGASIEMFQSSEEFSYNERKNYGPSNWNKLSTTCGFDHQSPINIVTSSAKKVTATKLLITKWNEIPQKIELENAGHSFKIRFEYTDGGAPTLTGGPLQSNYKYILHEVHYHFGENSYSGSEHKIDANKFVAESHAVFYNSIYGSFANAINYDNGLCVVGKLYKLTDSSNDYPYVPYLISIINFPTIITITDNTFSLQTILGDWNFDYFTYQGSLTTPPCAESVTWIVVEKPLEITKSTLLEFRELRGSSGSLMAPNSRPVQRTNCRKVKFSST